MEFVDVSSMKVDARDIADQGNHICTKQPYSVLLVTVKTECKEEPDSWTEPTDQSVQSETDGRQITDSLSARKEYYDGDGGVDVKQIHESKDMPVVSSQNRLGITMEQRDALYICEVCEKSFIRKYELNYHCRIHTTLHTCKVCEKAFFLGTEFTVEHTLVTNRTNVTYVGKHLLISPPSFAIQRYIRVKRPINVMYVMTRFHRNVT
jgi:hypothetical protein